MKYLLKNLLTIAMYTTTFAIIIKKLIGIDTKKSIGYALLLGFFGGLFNAILQKMYKTEPKDKVE